MSGRIAAIGGLLLLFWARIDEAIPAQKPHPDKDWRHPSNTMILGKFVHENNQLCLYTMDADPGEAGKVNIARWEMPSLRLTGRKELQLGNILDIQQGLIVPTPYAPRQPLLIMAGHIVKSNPPRDVMLLIDLRRAAVLGKEIPHQYDTLIGLEDNQIFLINGTSLQGPKLGIGHYVLEKNELRLRNEWSVPIVARRLLYADNVDRVVRLFYHAAPARQGTRAGNLEGAPGPVRVCSLDVDKGTLISDQLVQDNVTYPLIAAPPSGEAFYLLSGSQIALYSRKKLALDSAIGKGLLNLISEPNTIESPYTIARVDSQNKLLGVVSDPLGEVLVLNTDNGHRVLQDATHLRWSERKINELAQESGIPLGALWMRILDIAFVPGQKTLVALAGSGHLYYYDLERGKLARTAYLREGTPD